MDQAAIRQVLSTLERERAVHDEKYANNQHHKDCLPRFDKAEKNLRAHLPENSEDSVIEDSVIEDSDAAGNYSPPRLDLFASESALPDAIEAAARLERQARDLERSDKEQSGLLRQTSREILFKELNELDGFDR